MDEKLTRREFLSKAAVGTVGIALAGTGMLASPRAYGANDRLSVGVIGYGQRCQSLLKDFEKAAKSCNAEITAVCDIWTRNLDACANRVKGWGGPEPRTFRYMEQLLALDDLDGVIIATCDFQHATMLAQAVRAGKDVYCEKPFANDLDDARDALKAVEDSGRIVQIGTQRRSEGKYQAAAEFIAAGKLGTISKVDVEWNYFGARWRRADVGQVNREDTNWRRFLMGKPYRPWDPHQYMEWRLFRDFSTGIPDQWMSHMMDVVHWVTGEDYPKSAVAMGGTYVWRDGRQNGDTFQALLEYPKGFLCSYSTKFGNSAGDHMVIYGTNGTMNIETSEVTGDGGGDEKIKEKITLEKLPGVNHMQNWLDCVRSRKQPNAHARTGYCHSIATILAVAAMESGRRAVYHPEEMQISLG